jgi:hypothetical protein
MGAAAGTGGRSTDSGSPTSDALCVPPPKLGRPPASTTTTATRNRRRATFTHRMRCSSPPEILRGSPAMGSICDQAAAAAEFAPDRRQTACKALI